MRNTRDLLDFGLKELRLAARLLLALRTSKDHTFILGDKVTPEFNRESGFVFLIDDNFNVAMLNGNYLEDWLVCPQCNTEGFWDTLDNETAALCCKTHAKEKLGFRKIA